jgi:ABC-type antimicrobial peptide transport system permease subunit
MNKIKNKIKLFSLTLSILVMFQSCTVYKSTTVSLEQATKEQIKAKVETKNQAKINFKYIINENGNYFGMRKVEGKMEKMQLNEKLINTIKLKDKTTSTILSIALPIGIIAGLGLIFQDSFKWKSNTIDLSF